MRSKTSQLKDSESMNKTLFSLRKTLLIFITLLILSGLTAFPPKQEIDFLSSYSSIFPAFLNQWIDKVQKAISQTPEVVLYGTDWLAFAHIIIALFFIPVYLNPVKHKSNVFVGMAACLLVFPLAFICGPIRGIPFFHQLIDCAFGFFGILFLLYILKKINHLKNYHHETDH